MENKLNLAEADDLTIEVEAWIPVVHFSWNNGVLFGDYKNQGATMTGFYLMLADQGKIKLSTMFAQSFTFKTNYLDYMGTEDNPTPARFALVIDVEDVKGAGTTVYKLYINGELKETLTESDPLMERPGQHLYQG